MVVTRGQTVGIPGHCVGDGGHRVGYTGQAVGSGGHCVVLSGQTVPIAGQDVGLSGHLVLLFGQNVGTFGQLVRLGHHVAADGDSSSSASEPPSIGNAHEAPTEKMVAYDGHQQIVVVPL